MTTSTLVGRRRLRALLGFSTALCSGLPFVLAPATAQQAGSSGYATSVTVRAPDENGVDMYSGSIRFSIPDTGIGGLSHIVRSTNPPDPKTSALAFARGLFMDNYQATLATPTCPSSGSCTPTFDVGTATSSETFRLNTNTGGFDIGTNGGQLVSDPSSTDANCANAATYSCKDWLYIERDGTTISISNPNRTNAPAVISKIVHPDGLIERITHVPGSRTILSVNRSDGLQLKYQYGANNDLQKVVAVNNAYEYCDPTATQCSLTQGWPSSSYSWGDSAAGSNTILTIADSAGRATRYTLDSLGRVRSVKPPTSASDTFSIDYCLRRTEYNANSSGPRDPHACFYYVSTYNGGSSMVYIEDRVLSITRDGQTWNYGYPVQGSTINPNEASTVLPITSTPPDGHITTANQSLNSAYLENFSAPGVSGTFEQNLANKLSTAYSWAKGGVSYSYSYDGRANILSDGFVSAGYDSTCQNVKTCNSPNWTKDAKSNETDYVYDPQHGGVLSITSPAGVNGVRPQTRFSYAQRYAWFLNSAGQMVRSADPVWKVVSKSTCQNSAAAPGGGCVQTNDEVLTTYDYGPDSGPNNLWLRGTTVTAGGVSRQTTYSYDQYGHQLSTTSPRGN